MLREGKYMHNTHMCSFQGSSLFIPVNTTNFIPNHHQSHGIKSHRIASHRIASHHNLRVPRQQPALCCVERSVHAGPVTSSLPLR